MARILIIVIAYLALSVSSAAPIDDSMTLVEAIDTVRSLGHDVSYSSQLVKEWMRVRETPAGDDPLNALEFALQTYGLALETGPGNTWLVVRGERPPPPPGAAVAEPAPAPPGPSVPRPIEEITIVASRYAMYQRRAGADQFLTGDEIQQMPHIADDAFRAFHRLPGAAASDFRAPFNLRGGSVDEVRIQLDGLELIEPYHMRTLFSPLSIIDPGIIGEAEVLPGGFTAEHGNAMSGVINIESARPESLPVHEVGVSFVSAIARSSGRILDDRGGYFVSARRGYLDLIAEQVVDDEEELTPRYQDLFAGFSYDINDNLEVSVKTLLADDDVTFIDPGDGEDFREDSSIRYLWLVADYEPVPGVSSRTSIFSGNVETQETGSQTNLPSELISRSFHRDIELFGVQSDWTMLAGDRHMFKTGFRARDLAADYDYDLNAMRRSDFVNNGMPFFVQRDVLTSADGRDYGVYGSWRTRLGDRLTAEVGVRWDRQTYSVDDSQVSPRLNAFYQLGDRTELRLAWGKYFQPHAIHDLAAQDGDIAFRSPEEAEHRVIGLTHEFSSGLILQADLYDKRYRELGIRYENVLDVYEFAPESNFDRVLVNPDEGRAYGVELTLRNRETSALSWWINYTNSRATDAIAGETVPRSWDQRNAVTANLAWQGERWRVSAVARYHSGWPRTPLIVLPVTDGSGNIVGIDADLSNRNIDEFDDYSRVDIRVTRSVDVSRGSFEFYFELFNVFDSVNQCCTSNHTLNIGPSVSVSPLIDDFLPRFPSFGFIWKFGPGTD